MVHSIYFSNKMKMKKKLEYNAIFILSTRTAESFHSHGKSCLPPASRLELRRWPGGRTFKVVLYTYVIRSNPFLCTLSKIFLYFTIRIALSHKTAPYNTPYKPASLKLFGLPTFNIASPFSDPPFYRRFPHAERLLAIKYNSQIPWLFLRLAWPPHSSWMYSSFSLFVLLRRYGLMSIPVPHLCDVSSSTPMIFANDSLVSLAIFFHYSLLEPMLDHPQSTRR